MRSDLGSMLQTASSKGLRRETRYRTRDLDETEARCRMLIRLSTHRTLGPHDLVDLLGACHQRIRRFVTLAQHAGSRPDVSLDDIAQACADVDRYFTQALPLHVADEEESIEPRLRGLSPVVDEALDVTARQHEQHQPEVNALLRAIRVLRECPRDDTARREVAAIASVLQTQFEAHLLLEESVLFPAIRELLSHETQAVILDELRRRR